MLQKEASVILSILTYWHDTHVDKGSMLHVLGLILKYNTKRNQYFVMMKESKCKTESRKTRQVTACKPIKKYFKVPTKHGEGHIHSQNARFQRRFQ